MCAEGVGWQVSVAAQKLEKAQALLRISVAKGLKLKASHTTEVALGHHNEDPCSTLACERARTDGGRHAMSQNTQQTLKSSLEKHPVNGPDANNPLFHDARPPSPHPPPPHLSARQTAHAKFEARFKELAQRGDSVPPTPHPPHSSQSRRGAARGEGHGHAAARNEARQRLHHMHAAASHPRGRGAGTRGGGEDGGAAGRDSKGSVQRVSEARERLAAKARHGQGLAARAHAKHNAFHFPAYMVRDSATEPEVRIACHVSLRVSVYESACLMPNACLSARPPARTPARTPARPAASSIHVSPSFYKIPPFHEPLTVHSASAHEYNTSVCV